MTVCEKALLTLLLTISTGVYIGWLFNMATVTEGDNLNLYLVLNREPGIAFTVTVNATNLNTTGKCFFFCFFFCFS